MMMQELILRAWKNKGMVYYLVLVPLSWLFGIIVALRRTLYRAGLFKSYALPVPVIVVGNINIGGSGKTPVVIWLAEQLKQAGYQPAVVSRGYGVKNKQAKLVTSGSDASVVGDEPLLLAKRAQVPVCVGVNRVRACKILLDSYKQCDVIISDDGLQHYRLKRDIEIALIDQQSQAGQRLLPAGPLREPFTRLQSVDYVIANGGADVNDAYKLAMHGQHFYNLLQPSKIVRADFFANQAIVAIAGIGKPVRFFEHLKCLGLTFQSKSYPDHFVFTAQDLDNAKCDALLMTEKDAVKCAPFAQAHHWVLPIKAKIGSGLFAEILKQLKKI